MAVKATWQRYFRISTEATPNAAGPAAKAEWNIGGNGGGTHGWMDAPIPKDTDGLQWHPPLIYPTTAAGVAAMNTADPIAGASVPELGSLPFYVYPELTDRILKAVMGQVGRVETAGSLVNSGGAMNIDADPKTLTPDTQSNGTEQIKFVVAGTSAASSAKIEIMQSAAVIETITVGTLAGAVDGTYYSKGGYNGGTNALSFVFTGFGTDGNVTITGVDKVTNTFTWYTSATPVTLAIEQGGRQESASNSEYFTGVIVPQCSFNYDRSAPDNLLMGEMTLHGMAYAAATANTYKNDAATYYKPIAGWTGAVTIDGGANSEFVTASLQLNNNNELYAVSSGLQASSGAISGEYEVMGEFSVLPGDATRYTDFINATNRTLELTFTTPHYIVDTTGYQVKFTFTRVFFGDYTRNRRSMAQAATIPFRAVYNSTDAGACKITTVSRMPV